MFSHTGTASKSTFKQRTISVSSAAALVMALGFIPAAEASESEDDDVMIVGGSSGASYQLSDEDAQMMSEAMGITVGEAQARFAGQDEFSEAAAAIEQQAPLQYSAAIWGQPLNTEAPSPLKVTPRPT